MAVKVGMVSLGCPKNQMDAELMLAKLEAAGFEITAESGLAQVVIVNTCGFIADAKQESIENILEFAQLKKEKQIRKIIVTGCLAQRYQQELADEIPECDGVIGLGANDDIVDVVRRVMADETVRAFPSRDGWCLDGARLQTTPHFFAYLRIADGCNNRCTYCAIPGIRGNLRSRTIENVVAEAEKLVADGVRELVLVAQDTTVYGQDLYGESRLPQLLTELCKIRELKWIRLLYCYPEHITDDLLAVMAREEKVLPYMDIPLQHAAGSVLKRMNRPGNRESLTALIGRIRAAVPDITLRTTVMVGFPGETEADFEELCQFIQEARFQRLGCFAFSPEEDTPAYTLPDQLPDEVKYRRRDIVMEEQSRISDAYNQQMIDKTVTVLVESFDKYAECWFGRTVGDAPDIDGKVFFAATRRIQPGDFVQVTIVDTMDWDLIGEMTE
ncbi:MAG: 30S ribosomal protein S12 methylthiotransferase RimO [Clostridia bacterium]|nr:30S ribosomal protein S12 methylthiotransferase RimO [Clostridia bacterium]